MASPGLVTPLSSEGHPENSGGATAEVRSTGSSVGNVEFEAVDSADKGRGSIVACSSSD